jgi:hypothetical protein
MTPERNTGVTENYIFKVVEEDGALSEVELAPGEVLDCGTGNRVGYFPQIDQVHINNDGLITVRERSARSA